MWPEFVSTNAESGRWRVVNVTGGGEVGTSGIRELVDVGEGGKGRRCWNKSDLIEALALNSSSIGFIGE